MTYEFSLRKNLALLTEAFLGPRDVRDAHRRSIQSPISVQSGLHAIGSRWPDVRSRNQTTPIFIFSAGWRSGSTFLQRWVMTGGQVMMWGEPYRYADLIQSLAGQLQAFTQSWPSDEFFAQRNDDPSHLSQAWVANLYPPLPSFMDAHISYLEKLFLEPALALDRGRWGLKEVTLSVDHARYLKWLFPQAKFLFLYRDPYDAYGSYRKWRSWYKTWPTEPVFTATRYGAIWRNLAADFVKNHQDVGGLLLRYEELRTPAIRTRLQDYLGLELAEPASLSRVGATGTSANRAEVRSHWMPRLEALLLKRQVEPVSRQLGYRR